MVLIYSTWFLNVSGKSTMDVYSEFISYLWTGECNAGVYFVNIKWKFMGIGVAHHVEVMNLFGRKIVNIFKHINIHMFWVLKRTVLLRPFF